MSQDYRVQRWQAAEKWLQQLHLWGRFLYEGKVMVDPVTGSPWARKGAKKVVTERPLTYSNPKATPHWFDTAKDAHGIAWVKGVKQIAGGGTK